jgi:hypothetical protein
MTVKIHFTFYSVPLCPSMIAIPISFGGVFPFRNKSQCFICFTFIFTYSPVLHKFAYCKFWMCALRNVYLY